MKISRFLKYFFAIISILFSSAVWGATPVNGQNDCGLIQGGIFYSDAYGPPAGTPAVSGSCSWVKMSNTVCAVRNYGGTNYDLYPHTYICSMPFDDHAFLLVVLSIVLGFYWITKLNAPIFKPNLNS